MIYLAAVLAVTVLVLWDRCDRLVDQLDTERAELLAAETDLRAAGGSPRARWRQRERRCPGFRWANPGPSTVELHAWIAEADGLPWGRMTDGLAADIIDDGDGCTPRLSLTAPVSTARLRRLVAA